MSGRKIKLVVFDLDYTLWPFYVDCHVRPPFRKNSREQVIDAFGEEIKHYRDVPETLKFLKEEGYILGVASRTGAIEEARQLIKLFDWEQYFTYYQIFPGCKIKHFEYFKQRSRFDYSQMLFFDDEKRNIQDITSIGGNAILVEKGVNRTLVSKALKMYNL